MTLMDLFKKINSKNQIEKLCYIFYEKYFYWKKNTPSG